VIGLVAIILFSFDFFVVQPIGAIPDGTTIFYFRLGLNTSFIASADGFLLDNGQDVSLRSRCLIIKWNACSWNIH
jgi:hypothetical protein